jgi:hypothetical protein
MCGIMILYLYCMHATHVVFLASLSGVDHYASDDGFGGSDDGGEAIF